MEDVKEALMAIQQRKEDDAQLALRRKVSKIAFNPHRYVASVENFLKTASKAQLQESLALLPDPVRRKLPKRTRVRLGVMLRPLAARAAKTEPPLTRLASVNLIAGYLAAVSLYENEQLR